MQQPWSAPGALPAGVEVNPESLAPPSIQDGPTGIEGENYSGVQRIPFVVFCASLTTTSWR